MLMGRGEGREVQEVAGGEKVGREGGEPLEVSWSDIVGGEDEEGWWW